MLAHLVDEQHTVPMPDCNETGGTPNTLWSYDYSGTTFPVEVEIDLQAKYALSNCQLFFQGGGGHFLTLEYKDENDQWVEFISYPTGSHFGWKNYDELAIETQFIKIINPDPNAGIKEIGLCGTIIEADCPSSLNLSDAVAQDETFQAGAIISAATIPNSITVDYLAENNITLMPGFHAVGNSDFLAMITSCPNNFSSASLPAHFIHLPTADLASQLENDLQVHPNPFQSSTNLVYSVATPSNVQLDIFTPTGKKIKTLINNTLVAAGTHQINFNPSHQQGGFYIARLQIGQTILVKKLILTNY